MFEEYWQQILSIGTPTLVAIVYGGYKYIKNKLANNVVKDLFAKVKSDLPEEDYNAITTVAKSYLGTKGIKALKELIGQVEILGLIVPVIIGMAQNQLALGVYDDQPEIKNIIEIAVANYNA